MAETYSTEYTVLLQTTVGAKTYGPWQHMQSFPFTYTQVANGTAADTIILGVLPPRSCLCMHLCYFEWAGWTSGATLSVGWKAYRDLDGAAVALSAAGLLSAVSMSVDGAWAGGMLVVATPDDSAPVVWKKEFSSSTEVVIYATIGTQAPGAADTLAGELVFRHP